MAHSASGTNTGISLNLLGTFWQFLRGAIRPRVAYDSRVMSREQVGALALESSLVHAPGTGGVITPYLVETTTAGALRLESDSGMRPLPPVGDMVATIRSTFGLNITDTAQVCLVQRPTIYSWIRGNSMPNVEHLGRIETLYQLSKEWAGVSGAPILELRDVSGDPSPLLSLLTREEIDSRQVLLALKNSSAAARRSTANKGSGIAAKARSFGIKQDPNGADDLKLLTGQRLNDE